jgi:hypothetical protein
LLLVLLLVLRLLLLLLRFCWTGQVHLLLRQLYLDHRLER